MEAGRPFSFMSDPLAPPLLALQDVALTFGATPLFESLDLAVHARERLCLVGRNGSGKSTALKIAAGMVEPDGGTRFLQPGTTVRYLAQEPDLSAFATIGAYVEDGLAPADANKKVVEFFFQSRRVPVPGGAGETRHGGVKFVGFAVSLG